jgi:hypothetical protein
MLDGYAENQKDIAYGNIYTIIMGAHIFAAFFLEFSSLRFSE